MNSIASRKLGELGEWWLDWGHRWRSRGLDRSSLRCYPGTGCRHRPARTARPHNRGPPICAPAASLLSPAISRNARFADCSANNVGVTARFVTNPELTDDTDVTRWVLVPRVTYWPALFTLRPVRYSKCSSPGRARRWHDVRLVSSGLPANWCVAYSRGVHERGVSRGISAGSAATKG